MRLRIATFNIRNTTDRYGEREPLLKTCVSTLNADLLALQEVNFSNNQDTSLLGDGDVGIHELHPNRKAALEEQGLRGSWVFRALVDRPMVKADDPTFRNDLH